MWIGPIGKKHSACHLGYNMDLYHQLKAVNSQQAEQITRSLRSLSVYSSFDNNMKILELYLVHKNVKTKQGFNKDWCTNLFCGGHNKLTKLWRCISRVSYTFFTRPGMSICCYWHPKIHIMRNIFLTWNLLSKKSSKEV